MRTKIALNFLGAVMLLVALGGVSNAQAKPAAAAYTGCTNPGDQTDIPQVECEALVALYDGTTGASWTTNTGWKATDTPCTWYGVTCSGGNVTTLNLMSNNLVGSIPAELGYLSNLIYLYLSSNSLSGSIPTQLGYLSNLIYLYLSSNSLSGSIPTQLGYLSNLTHFSLYGNGLTGGIPTELGNLTNLTYMSLSRNTLTGVIPTQLGNLSNLADLRLYNNSLTGSIPAELGNLSNLTWLYLYNNSLTGSIPTQLGNLSNLTRLYLYNNSLSGGIPAELGNLSNLTRLYLYNNNLSGRVPIEVGSLSNLQYLYLHNNSLGGALPASLTNLTSLTTFNFSLTNLCEPSDTTFQTWLTGVSTVTSSGLTCLLANTSFESTIGAEWTQVNSGDAADNRHLHAASYHGDYLYALKAVGVTEYIMQSVAIGGGTSGDSFSLSSYFAGVNLASQGVMGHFVRVMNGASVVDTFPCVFARPGASFGWTQHTCNFTTTGSYDAIEVYIFILNIPSGIAVMDAVDLVQTGP